MTGLSSTSSKSTIPPFLISGNRARKRYGCCRIRIKCKLLIAPKIFQDHRDCLKIILRDHKRQPLFSARLWIKSAKNSTQNLRGGSASQKGVLFLVFEKLCGLWCDQMGSQPASLYFMMQLHDIVLFQPSQPSIYGLDCFLKCRFVMALSVDKHGILCFRFRIKLFAQFFQPLHSQLLCRLKPNRSQ